MRIGYPCLNFSLGTERSKTFRLASYSEERLIETVTSNLIYLEEMLHYNVEHNLLNFRIFSGIIPFASHEINTFDWSTHFADRFTRLGAYMREHNLRISFHPDQFTLINSPSEDIFAATVAELEYHALLLELFGLDTSHKIQIHVGGVYKDKFGSIERFIERFHQLPANVQQRLVIENDDRLYSLADCLEISDQTGSPVLFDTFHHNIFNKGESLPSAFQSFTATWGEKDGTPMIDYSSQSSERRVGSHADHIDSADFLRVLKQIKNYDVDIMLEIKDKEKSALAALAILACEVPALLATPK